MERGEGRAAFPDQSVEAGKPLPRDRLVDPALFIARREPWGDDLPDPRSREIEHLQAGPLGQSFGKELSQDFAGALVGADQRCHLEDGTFRAGVTVETRALVEDPIREPVGQHVEAEARPRLLSRSCISKQRAHQDIAGFGKGEAHGVFPSWGAGSPCPARSEEHTSELQSLMRISYAVFCLKKKKI